MRLSTLGSEVCLCQDTPIKVSPAAIYPRRGLLCERKRDLSHSPEIQRLSFRNRIKGVFPKCERLFWVIPVIGHSPSGIFSFFLVERHLSSRMAHTPVRQSGSRFILSKCSIHTPLSLSIGIECRELIVQEVAFRAPRKTPSSCTSIFQLCFPCADRST